MLLTPLLTVLASAPCLGDVHVDDNRGFQIEVPDGWRTAEQDLGGKGFVLSLLPAGSVGERGVSVTITKLEAGQTKETFLEVARKRVAEAGEAFSEYEEWEDELDGRAATAIRVRYKAPQGEYRLVQSFVVSDGTSYMLQRHAPVDEFAELEAEYEAVVDTFAVAEISAEGLADQRLAELAGRCGSEVDWAQDWAEAEARARDESKLVLAVAFVYRGFALNDTPRTMVFTNEDIVELVNERFVPFWYEPGVEAPFVESYGMSATTFGQALLLVTPGGDVVLETQKASDPDAAYPFLLAGLARNPEFTGAGMPAGLSLFERAECYVARGELEAAFVLLEDETTGRGHRLRARILRLGRDGEAALAALAAAREAGGEPESELLVEEAMLHVREGNAEEATERLERVLADHADTDAASQAALYRGLLELAAGDREAAKRRWRELAQADPETRWSWQAAASLRSTALDADIDLGLDWFAWPEEDVLREHLTFPESAPLPVDRDGEAARQALAWLLAAQRPDGSWPSATKSAGEGGGPDPFVDAITALAGRALLRYAASEGAEEAARRALDFLLLSIEARAATPPVVLFMDYMTWSDSMMLHFLADALEAELADAETLAPVVTALLTDLGERQQKDGGWSYYVTGDLDGDAAPAQSISFTTAAGVLGLARVRAAGFDVADEVLDPAVSALERMRDDEGVFAYFLFHDTGQARLGAATAGAVGRGPACELALMSVGKSDEERLRRSLEMFLEHAPLFAAEQGKVLMHAGPDGQGCHYLFFDYTHAALAEATLAPDPRTRAHLLELVMECRQPDGSFVDTPIIGRSYGTAMALLAFDALRATDG